MSWLLGLCDVVEYVTWNVREGQTKMSLNQTLTNCFEKSRSNSKYLMWQTTLKISTPDRQYFPGLTFVIKIREITQHMKDHSI